MPDFFNNRTGTAAIDGGPNGWGEAFAALPMETPSSDGWARLARKLDARSSRGGVARRERRTTWLIGVASAAVLVLAAWSPLSRWLQADVAEPPSVVTQAVPGMRGLAAPIRTEPDEPRPAVARVADASDAVSPALRETQSAHRKPARSTRVATARRHVEAEPTLTQPGTNNAIAVAAAEADSLQKLQAQSAQLEALVALARDDRVGNASSELLSSELDAGIAVIDAALSQADLAGAEKQELWQQRVDLLQQLAGVEATSRWLAAQGASSTTNLVAVD
jgi:hypothetical protein